MLKKSVPSPALQKLAGQKVAFVGEFEEEDINPLKWLVQEEGGGVVDGFTDSPDIVVVGMGANGELPAGVAEIQEKHRAVRVMDEQGLCRFTLPTADEFFNFLMRGPHSYDVWYRMRGRIEKSGTPIDLSGRDFRNVPTTRADLHMVILNECDLRGMTLGNLNFGRIRGATFDEARFEGGSFTSATDCSLCKIVMDDVRWNPAHYERCDFRESTLRIRSGSCTTAIDCNFSHVDLTDGDLEKSSFVECKFVSSVLASARLHKSDFTNADLTGANLQRADLRGAKLIGADLRKADFRGANLVGADLLGATIDGADFTGSNLSGVTAANVDVNKALGFAPRPERTAGLNMLELAKVALKSKNFASSVKLDLGTNEFVLLCPTWLTYGSRCFLEAGYSHHKGSSTFGSSVDAPTLHQGMLNLVALWWTGKPRLDSIKVKAAKCPISKSELYELAVAAWHEALELPIPTAVERKTRASWL